MGGLGFAWLIRTGRVAPGCTSSGTLTLAYAGEPCGWVRYTAHLLDPDNAELVLEFSRWKNGERDDRTQRIRIASTQPNFGGRRWWLVCPTRGRRVAALFRPQGGDRFASREAWRLAYRSQRIDPRDRPFEALFRFQTKNGWEQGWDAGPGPRYRGMWHRTYARLCGRYIALEQRCDHAAQMRFGF